ncbi:HprK-related kinase B [Solidesulfovibrio sp.]
MPTALIMARTATTGLTPPDCAAVIAASRVAMPYTLDLLLAGVRLTVRTNSPSLADALARHYRAFSGDGGPADIEVAAVDGPRPGFDLPFFLHGEADDDRAKEEYADLPDGRVVRKRRTGLWLVLGRAGNWIIGPCAGHPQAVVNCINARFADWALGRGACLLHAAGVALGATGLAVSGFAGAGKSTLALEIMRHGADFVTNDRALVHREAEGLVVTGIARPPRVNPGTILANDRLHPLLTTEERETYARLPVRELWGLERKYDVPIEACFGPGRVRLQAALAALVVLAWKPGGGPVRVRRTDIASQEDVLPAVMKDMGVLFAAGPAPADPAAYRTLLAGLPLLLVTGGVDFPAAAALCLDVLAAGA